MVAVFGTQIAHGQDKITLQLRWHHGGQFVGYYLAQEKGYYTEENLDVAFLEGGVGINHIDQVLQGKAQFGVAGSELIVEYLKGSTVQSTAVIFQHSPYAIMVRNNSGINNPQQLAGKRMYMGIIPRTAEIQAMLIREGVPLEKINLVDPLQIPSDFSDPTIDAFSVYQTNEPYMLSQKGIQAKLIKPIDYGIDFYGDCLFSTKIVLKQNPELSKRVIRASLKGWEYAFNNPEEAVKIIAKKYNTNNRSTDHLRYELRIMRSLLIPDHIPLGTQSLDRWRRIAETYNSLEMAPDFTEIDDFIYDPLRESNIANVRIRNVILIILSAVVSLTILLYFWSRSLRSKVALKTQSLHDEITSHKETLSKYSTLFHSFPYGITVSDSSGNIVETNEIAEQLLGVEKADHEGRKIDGREWKIIRPDGSEMPHGEWPSVRALRENRTVTGAEMGVVKPNGETVWLAVAATPLQIENYGVVVTYNDITQSYQERHNLNKLVYDQTVILDNIQSLIYFKDTENNIIHISKSVADVTGLPKNEIEGKHSREIYPLTADKYWVDDLEVIKSKKEKLGIIEPLTTKGGDTRWLLTDKIPYIDHKGEVEGVIVMATDITSLKQTENALAQSEQKWLNILINTPQLGVSLDPDGRIIFVNKRFLELTGWAEDEVYHKDWFETFIPEYDQKKVRQVFSSLLSKERDNAFSTYENDIITRSGDIISVAWSNVESIDTEGNVLEVNCLGIDLTERIKSENEIRKQQNLFETMFKTIPDGVVVTNKDREIILANDGMEHTFGYLAEELLGKSTSILYAGKSKFLQAGNQVYDKNSSNTNGLYMTRYKKKDGTEFSGETFGAKLFDADGEWIGNLGIMRDITEREQTEMQLHQAQKMESLGRLTGGVAHDFNNILGVILGYSELVIESIDRGSTIHNDVEKIHDAAVRSSEIVRQLLAFSRQQTISPKILDLNETIEKSLTILRRLIGEDIDLVWSPDTDLGFVKMDPTQVDQILANLCVNSRDAIGGPGKVNIGTKAVTLSEEQCKTSPDCYPGKFVQLEVSDSGCGISPENLDKIFEPFFTSKEVGKGTGLGLSTVYGIVRQNEGFIQVVSTLGKGTSFLIFLPAHKRDRELAAIDSTEDLPLGDHETILVVEDDKDLLKLTASMLRRLNYTVLATSETKEAINIARQHSPDIKLLLTDVIMPEMSGDELAMLLQSEGLNIKPLYMSGYTDDRIANKGILAEGVLFLQKPFSKMDLAKKVAEALKQ